MSKTELARVAKKERQLKNKVLKQKGLSASSKVLGSCEMNSTSDTSDDSFNNVDNNDVSSHFEFESASKFFNKSPLLKSSIVTQSTAQKSSKRPNSDEETENRRTRSKSNNFRNSSLVISKVCDGLTNPKQSV